MPDMVLLPFPQVLEIELTHQCDLHCRMCQRHVVRQHNRWDHLQGDMLDAILEQCQNRTRQINLGGMGESLLHPRLPYLLLRIKRADSKILTGINTNGQHLVQKHWGWLTDGRLDYLEISLNAPTPTDYQWLTGNDRYLELEGKIQAFLNHKKVGQRPLTTVHSFDIPPFDQENQNFLQRWRPWADFVQLRPLGNWVGSVDTSPYGVVHRPEGVCQRPWNSLAVDMTGGYYRCCGTFALETPRYSLQNTSMECYWHGPEMTSWRNQMEQGVFEENNRCQSCSGRKIPPNSEIEQRHLPELSPQARDFNTVI